MTATSRQNNLILNEDWKRIYQTFKNADFKSYDFENLRRVIIDYIRENYPEDFNDYIESSEYLALIDAIAFLGQSLSFRIDLASRENFIELAERKESVLRLARMLSYNAKRNIPASGLLKFDTISTTEDVIDSNGKNLAKQLIIWNDPTNSNWNEQFLLILNSAMADNTEFGRSQGSSVIQGIPTEQYRIRSSNRDVPIYSFSKSVSGRRMVFEILSTAFAGKDYIYEEDPFPGNQVGFIYRNDSKGPASANNGFFMMFKQGSLELADFNISVPTTNEKVSIDSEGINNSDLWLYSLNSAGVQQSLWTQVPSLTGNNIAYNSLVNQVKDIYSVVTKEKDKVDLLFSDGVYGNLPQGSFRVYYRVSNGLSYAIAPSEMRGITISIPYINKKGASHTLSISMSLKYTVTSSAPSESIDSIRDNAPASYYTQNRMITGEDYNLAPLTSSQDILKVKAINRTSSGISRNFDIVDASGKYSSVDVFADDGLIYKNPAEVQLTFKYTSKVDIYNFIRQQLDATISKDDVYNFYLTKFTKIDFIDESSLWVQSTSAINNSTGYFKKANEDTLLKTGVYTNNTLKYLTPESLIKFVAPAGKAFKKGKIVVADATDPEQTSYIWTKVIKVVGDGTNAGRGVPSTGFGPVSFSDVIPGDGTPENSAIASRIVPKFVSNIPLSLETEIVNLAFSNFNFGLRYDVNETAWKIITSANLDLSDDFSIGRAGDTSNSNLDASWIVAFVKEPDRYVVRIRTMEYVFGSLQKNRFYFDANQKIYDSRTSKVIKDQVKVLGINTGSNLIDPLKKDLVFEVSDSIRFDDGYQSTKEIKISFADSDDDGVIDNPDQFETIVGLDTDNKYLFFQQVVDQSGAKVYEYYSGDVNLWPKESTIDITNYNDGDLIYFYDTAEDVVKSVNRTNNVLEYQSAFRANVGRAGLKFQYIHNANVDRRIDPSVSNIIDVFLMTRSYDVDFRNYLSGASAVMPEPPTSESLKISFGTNLDSIKSISDEIIYHPVAYKVLFGSTADEKLQATFKVVKNPSRTINDNDLKVRIVNAMNTFFDVNNWDFGDKFYLSELITYVLNSTAPDISNMIIVPKQSTQVFGSLFEIQSRADEIFISGATVDDIEIVSSINAAEINVISGTVINSTSN